MPSEAEKGGLVATERWADIQPLDGLLVQHMLRHIRLRNDRANHEDLVDNHIQREENDAEEDRCIQLEVLEKNSLEEAEDRMGSVADLHRADNASNQVGGDIHAVASVDSDRRYPGGDARIAENEDCGYLEVVLLLLEKSDVPS